MSLRFQSIALFVCVLALLLCPASALAQSSSITLAWNASPDSSVAGYKVSWGTISGTYTSTVDVGNVTTWTATGLDPNQRYSFIVQAYNSDAGLSVPSNTVSNNGLIVTTGATIPADSKPGIFWHNDVTGQLMTWHLNGSTVIDTRPISISGVADTHWHVAGTGDLNGDGYPDILWRNDTDGSLAVWFLQGEQVIGTQYLSIPAVADFSWRIAGIGDVDGDGFADIVWQHTAGWLAVWFMRGSTVLSTRMLDVPQVSDTNWQIAAVTDLDGDGKADLVWHHATQGWVATWYLRGTAVTFTRLLSIPQVADPNWQLAAAGHVDSSGVPALVWRNTSDGTVALWTMSGYAVTGTVYTNPAIVSDQNWKIVGSR